MKIIEDEVIGELRYLTVEFDQIELIASGGVISQGAAQRYFIEKSPDLKVKNCGSFKLDSQRDIVTMRFGVVYQKPSIPGGSKTLLEDYVGQDQKLLNPGYDELKAKYDEIRIKYLDAEVGREFYADDLATFKKKYDEAASELLATHNALPASFTDLAGNTPLSKLVAELKEKCDKLQREKDIVGRLYDVLVEAVGKDAQKFSDLLVENEKLITAAKKISKGIDSPGLPDDPNDDLEIGYDIDNACHYGFEQGVLACNKILTKALSELADGSPDCDGGCNTCESHACDVDKAIE